LVHCSFNRWWQAKDFPGQVDTVSMAGYAKTLQYATYFACSPFSNPYAAGRQLALSLTYGRYTSRGKLAIVLLKRPCACEPAGGKLGDKLCLKLHAAAAPPGLQSDKGQCGTQHYCALADL
jgi:hypothetical protein